MKNTAEGTRVKVIKVILTFDMPEGYGFVPVGIKLRKTDLYAAKGGVWTALGGFDYTNGVGAGCPCKIKGEFIRQIKD